MSLTVEKCIQAWTNSLRQMKAKADIVFFGDSLMYYGNFASVFPNKVVCNLGLRGDTIQGMRSRIKQVTLLRPQIVYLMAGINDVANRSIDEFRENYESLLKTLIEQNPKTELIVFKLLPVNDDEFTISCNNEQIVQCNAIIASLCIKHSLCYIDLFSAYERNGNLPKELTTDGIHLSQAGFEKWYKLISNDLIF